MMNVKTMNLLIYLKKIGYDSHRDCCNKLGYSIGTVNDSLFKLKEKRLITDTYEITSLGDEIFNENKPNNAIILAAGPGSGTFPLNSDIPKGLIEINSEFLIERLIRQLHEVEITDIVIVVGHLKEKYEYLIDMFGVKLIVNRDYIEKNNLHSLSLVSKKIDNTYIIPCDVWCHVNPFSKYEVFSWYMVTKDINKNSYVKVGKSEQLFFTKTEGNKMIGISYISRNISTKVVTKLQDFSENANYANSFWEEILKSDDRLITFAKVQEAYEFNTIEEIREVNDSSKTLESNSFKIIKDVFCCNYNDILNVNPIKYGMTNRSFQFTVNEIKYIMRLPGEGTSKLINRKQENDVYQTISKYNISDEVLYFDPITGIKITKFIENSSVCDSLDFESVGKCFESLKQFHSLKLTVEHEFDIINKIELYEGLWNGKESNYKDYLSTKFNCLSLISYCRSNQSDYILCHIDSVPDNFLFYKENNKTNIRLIDWEYAGMCDPKVDLAMFIIYSIYDAANTEKIIDLFYDGECTIENRLCVYAYISLAGLLWSNWCEYKLQLGVDFGEYSLSQYKYAKDYYKKFMVEYKEYYGLEWNGSL